LCWEERRNCKTKSSRPLTCQTRNFIMYTLVLSYLS
jgi:Fe-S-cluster containining protein